MVRIGRLAARQRKPTRPMLESLEERLTPSGGNPTVTQTAGGYTALTAAVAADTAANTNYVIQITNSFTFTSGEQVSISKLGSGSTLTVEGQNGTNYTLTGNGNRLFTVASGQNVTFENLTLTGGSVTNSKFAQGGALLDQGGTVTLSKVTVQGNAVKGGTAQGGGIYASGAGTLAIRDSLFSDNSAQGVQGADGTAAGKNGSAGGSAYGGGLYVAGNGWTVTLIGDTLSGNTAMGGNGGNGASGSNATGSNAQGGAGGGGGYGGEAWGGAAYFSSSGSGGGLTILNDAGAPITDPSTWIDNSAQAGAGGNGGAGGSSTGTASDTRGGQGGYGGRAFGGAVYVTSFAGAPVRIGNSAFYANKATGGNDGTDGLTGTGGQPIDMAPPLPQPGGDAVGGGLALSVNNVTMVNSTVAGNSSLGGIGTYNGFSGIGPRGYAWGGGIYDVNAPIHDPPPPQPPSPPASVFANNTITQNAVEGGGVGLPPPQSSGAGIFVGASTATLVNNLIQGNQGIGSSAPDLDSGGATLNSANNNFIGTMSANAVSTSANIVGNTQVQLGNVVDVDAHGNPTGGPIYYPLLSGTVSIGAGSSSVLNTIAGVEGTTAANAVDEIGNPRSSNGVIDLGAVQTVTAPPPSPPSPPSPPTPPALNVPPLLAFLDSLLGGTMTVNGNGTETITDSFFGIPLVVAIYDGSGNLVSAALFGFTIPNWVWLI